MASSWSRELLVADIALERGLASLHAIAEGLQEFRSSSETSDASVEDFLASSLGLEAEERRGLFLALGRRLAAAGGDPRRALGDAGDRRRSLQLSIHAAAGPRRQGQGSSRRGEDPDKLRTVGSERFSEPLLAGEGGMGLVYMVRDEELRRYVALKAIKAPADDGQPVRPPPESPFEQRLPAAGSEGAERYEVLRRRFLNEARITGRLEHPGIVPVYEIGETQEGILLYTMKFVSTHRTLADDIESYAGRPVSERMALLEPFLKVCDAMEYAHSQGILHRDLKPSNVAIGEFGEALVLDWGLAKVHEENDEYAAEWPTVESGDHEVASDQTPPTAIGTLGYMSAEAAAGDIEKMGPYSDVCSLGAVLYEILVGRLPHPVESIHEWLYRVIHEDAPEPAALDDAVPAGLSLIAVRAVDRDCERRPASAGALGKAIRAWQVADEETREVARLDRDARESLERATVAHADERLRLLERAALRLQQIGEIRPDTPDLAERREKVEQLRAKALRARTWRLVRIPLAAVAVLAVAVIASNAWFEWRAIDTRLSAAGEAIATEHPHRARERARDALALVARARVGFLPEAVIANQAERARKAVLDAHVMEGSVSGLAHAAAQVLTVGHAEGAGDRYRSLAAAAFAELGQFEVTRNLLREGGGGSPEDEGRLLDAYLRLGQREEARALAKATGDETTIMLLDRYTMLRELEMPGALGVVRTEIGGVLHLVFVSAQGAVHLWKQGEREPRQLTYVRPLRAPYIRCNRPGVIVLYGRETVPGGGGERLAVVEVDLATNTQRLLRRGPETTPRSIRVDLDGDGQDERLLSYAAGTRGVEVMTDDGELWPRARLGDLAFLQASHESNANVDTYQATLYPSPGGGRSLLVGTGAWSTEAYAFGMIKFGLGPEKGAIRLTGTQRVGIVESFCRADLDGDGSDECYLWNSYAPRTGYGDVRKEFRPLGVHRFDLETLALTEHVLGRSSHSGYFQDELGKVQIAGMGWRYAQLGSLELPDGRASLAVGTDIAGPDIVRDDRYLELLFREKGAYRAWPVPTTQPSGERSRFVIADIVPEAPGDEMIVICTAHDVAILGRAPPAAPRAKPVRGRSLHSTPVVWSVAEGLREGGRPGLAAELYENPAYHAEGDANRSERWRRALRCQVEAADVERAAAALAQASVSNGIPRIERDVWEARIAIRAHKPEAALALYRAALAGLGSASLRADLHARLGSESSDDLEREIYEAVKRLGAAAQRWKQRWRFGEASGSASGLPEGWAVSHALLTPESSSTQGVDLALDARRGHTLRIGLEVSEVDSFRAWADVTVNEQPYGSQLCFALSQSERPALPDEDGALEDAIWLFLDRGDGAPRGIGGQARIGGNDVQIRLGEGTRHTWPWGRPLRLEFDYQRAQRDGESRFRIRCIDGLSGVTLTEREILGLGRLNAGRYWLGFWGTPTLNQWNRHTHCTIHAVGCDVRARNGPTSVAVPTADGGALVDGGIVRRAWRAWEAGQREAAVEMLVDAQPDPGELARWLVGPRARAPSGLVADCLRAVPGLEDALFSEEVNARTALIAVDPELLVALHEGGHLRGMLDHRRLVVANALEATGQLSAEWKLLESMDVPDDVRFHPRKRLAEAIEAYQRAVDGPPRESPQAPGRRAVDLVQLIRGALALGHTAKAREYLTELLANEALEQEGIKDDPAVRRLLMSKK